jgi:hypothetical protein
LFREVIAIVSLVLPQDVGRGHSRASLRPKLNKLYQDLEVREQMSDVGAALPRFCARSRANLRESPTPRHIVGRRAKAVCVAEPSVGSSPSSATAFAAWRRGRRHPLSYCVIEIKLGSFGAFGAVDLSAGHQIFKNNPMQSRHRIGIARQRRLNTPRRRRSLATFLPTLPARAMSPPRSIANGLCFGRGRLCGSQHGAR